MAAEKSKVWIMHSGMGETAHKAFVEAGYVSLGWYKMGDLRKLPNDRKAFLSRFREKHREENQAASRVKAGELYRFCHEMERGDWVIYNSSTDGHVHVGRVLGDYEFRPHHHKTHQHVRKIEWLKSIKTSTISKGQRAILRFRLSISRPRINLRPILSLIK